MPTKERYARDKAYYHEWNTSERGKAADRRKHKKRAAEGRCLRCGRPFEKYLGEHQFGCIHCLDELTAYNQLRSGGF